MLGVYEDIKAQFDGGREDGKKVSIADLIVLGGSVGVERAAAAMKEAGAKRALMLPVSAPFHSVLMQPAAAVMANALAGVDIQPPAVPLIANVRAEAVTEPGAIRRLLVEQADLAGRAHRPHVGVLEARDDAQERRLAGAVLPDERGPFAGGDGEGDVGQDAAVGVALRDAVETKVRAAGWVRMHGPPRVRKVPPYEWGAVVGTRFFRRATGQRGSSISSRVRPVSRSFVSRLTRSSKTKHSPSQSCSASGICWK